MIDFHTHVLPGMDDGSRDADMSLKMLSILKEQGIETAVATPHFYASREGIDSFLRRRNESLSKLKDQYSNDLPRLATGAEVSFFPGISKAGRLEELCICQTRILLLEMPFTNWDENIYSELYKLSLRDDIRLLLAHIERFINYQKRGSYWNKILELDLTCQCNTEAFAERRSRRKALELIKSGQKTVLGSDCHNTTDRKPDFTKACNIIRKHLGPEVLDSINDLGNQLISENLNGGIL